MASLPRIVNPLEPLFVRDGIEIALITVEAWPQRVVVRVSALPSELTEARERQYHADVRAWGAARRASASKEGAAPPEAPGEELLSPLDVHLTDDRGTRYTWRVRTGGGGSGTHWDAVWIFEGVPADVDRLVVHVAAPDGSSSDVAVDLPG